MKQSRIIGTALAVGNGVLILLCAIFSLGKDRQEPEITFEAAETVYREGIAAEELLKGVSARDKEDGDLSGRIVIEKISENREEGTAVVFYAVSDGSGNVARASRVFEAVFADKDEESVANQFLDAGIEAELKEGNIVNTSGTDKGTGNDKGEGEKAGGDASHEDTAREDMHDNTKNDREERTQDPYAAQTPSPSPAHIEQPSPSPTPAIGREEGQAHGEPERESEDSREPEAGAESENMPEAAPDQETGNTANAQAPVLSLKVSEIEVKAGQGPAWVDIIGTLSDDKDGYETLFRNLNVSRYDRNKPGAYQVSVSTQDTDGNQSEAVPLTIIVK